MALEIIGKLIKILPEQSGMSSAGKAWKKQEFVVETEDQYPKNVCITAFGDKSDVLKSLQEGERLKVSIDIESREFKEKWYTNINAWRIERMNESSSNAGGSSKGGDIPTPPPVLPSSDDDGDGLPF